MLRLAATSFTFCLATYWTSLFAPAVVAIGLGITLAVLPFVYLTEPTN